MDIDDIIYVTLLLFCIGFGYFYREIKNVEQKKWIGTGVGLLIIFIVSGYHIWHSFLTYIVNAVIITLVPKRQCHLVSFIYSFTYLLFFRTTLYFGIEYPPSHTNLVQMVLTLKLVGLAFEVNTTYLTKKREVDVNETLEQTLEHESNDVKVNFIDIFHYSFNYIGVLTGPYYRYKTFQDYFNLPFARYAPWREETIEKLKYVPLYAVIFLLASYIWPLSYSLSDEFYDERSWLYRFWYVWPIFLIFRMRIYIGIVLSECVCTMAGFGSYPVVSQPKPGLGPSTNLEELEQIVKDEAELERENYDYETIRNVKPYSTDFCTTFREAMKHWNICIQYWLAVNVYKRFPSKKYRTLVTMFVSAFWHGVYTGHYICIVGAPFYLAIEDVYVRLILKDNKGTSLKIWEWVIWFFKMQAFSFLGFPFLLLVLPPIIRYYNSIYYCGFVGGAILYLIGIRLLKIKKSKMKLTEKGDIKEKSK